LQESIQIGKCSIENGEHVLQNKINGKVDKEEMWLSIEEALKSFLEKSFKSKQINKFV